MEKQENRVDIHWLKLKTPQPSVASDNYRLFAVPELVMDAPVSIHAKVLYGYINRMSQKAGMCWASNGTLASKVDCSESTIKRALSQLEEHGFVLRQFVEPDGTIRAVVPANGRAKGQAKALRVITTYQTKTYRHIRQGISVGWDDFGRPKVRLLDEMVSSESVGGGSL